jgi:hypothetical protein
MHLPGVPDAALRWHESIGFQTHADLAELLSFFVKLEPEVDADNI